MTHVSNASLMSALVWSLVAREDSLQMRLRCGVKHIYIVYVSREVLGSPVSVCLPEDQRIRVETLATAGRSSRAGFLRETVERGLGYLTWEHSVVENGTNARLGRLHAVTLALFKEQPVDADPVGLSRLDDVK